MRLFIYLLRTEQSSGKVIQMLEKKMKGRVTKLAKEIVTRWKRIATQYESPVQVVEAVNDNDDHQPTSDDAEEVKEEWEVDAKAEASNIYK